MLDTIATNEELSLTPAQELRFAAEALYDLYDEITVFAGVLVLWNEQTSSLIRPIGIPDGEWEDIERLDELAVFGLADIMSRLDEETCRELTEEDINSYLNKIIFPFLEIAKKYRPALKDVSVSDLALGRRINAVNFAVSFERELRAAVLDLKRAVMDTAGEAEREAEKAILQQIEDLIVLAIAAALAETEVPKKES